MSELSPLARRLFSLLTGDADDPTHWPEAPRLSVGLVGLGDGTPVRAGVGAARERFALSEHARQRLVEPARELVGFLGVDTSGYLPVVAGLAGMDAEVRATLGAALAPIAVAELDLVLGWDVELRALFAEAAREPRPGVAEWLDGLPGYPGFARTALETARARVVAIHAGELAYQADRAFDEEEKTALGRAVRVALLRDEPWLPELLDELVPGLAVAPTQARTLPSQGLLFEIARAAEEYPTPEVISALRAARRVTRHAKVPVRLDQAFKRMEPALANRLEVAFRLPDGRVREVVGEHTAVISTDGKVELSWWHGDRRLKSVPAAVKREHPEEVKRLRELAKRTAQRQATLARALEAAYTSATPPPYRQLAEHPIASRLIWEFEISPGLWRAELGMNVPGGPVRLWHPARARVEEVRAWREEVQGKELRQPFKQAFREVYLLTPAEEAAGASSSRFEGHVVDYRRLRALLNERGWRAPFLGRWEAQGPAYRVMAGGRWRAVLGHHLYDDHHAEIGQVRFERAAEGTWRQAALAEVPPLVFSEAMRDVDLFVGVASITADPLWPEYGPDGLMDRWRAGSSAPLQPSAEVRRDALSRLIGRTAIAGRCTLTGRFLVVRGDLRTYKIHLGSANVLMEPDDAYLCVVSARDPHAAPFLPFEEDGRLALILSKAFLLANDTAITDPSITRQLRG
ncbi:DUF4132 domain-containing protein [Nonomuraea gerenzanensis]|uniref:Uncharacterized protein n=1 Tax=Nonomuraea gerenzanensis TaxID=93944 RepID=A0A1M4EA79_9ACTN|nr:DUF4132 domain-containing protein [Nonomuraea gerenzanensis]UBU17915.1 DUF4132 domain-containing protein [Nonomuraea gerenzanensis]SBO95710.1 FIG01130473: hypothetical protein [Nonomuraea gerenzanensis]